MSKIYYLMGKSSTGKDTIYKELRKRMPQLKNVTIYTTRPRREGEKEGEEYFFTDENELEKFKTEGRLIEERAYNTVYGIWHYFTADDGQFNFEQKNQDYLMIGTLESYEKLKTFPQSKQPDSSVLFGHLLHHTGTPGVSTLSRLGV